MDGDFLIILEIGLDIACIFLSVLLGWYLFKNRRTSDRPAEDGCPRSNADGERQKQEEKLPIWRTNSSTVSKIKAKKADHGVSFEHTYDTIRSLHDRNWSSAKIAKRVDLPLREVQMVIKFKDRSEGWASKAA